MKIIKIDNYNRESVSDVLIAENVSEVWACRIVSLLNDASDLKGSDYFCAVNDDYKLYKYEP